MIFVTFKMFHKKNECIGGGLCSEHHHPEKIGILDIIGRAVACLLIIIGKTFISGSTPEPLIFLPPDTADFISLTTD